MLTLKQTKSLLLSFVILCTVTLNGCASINDEIWARKAVQKAVYRTYAVTSDEAWEISKEVFRGAVYSNLGGIYENKFTDSVIVGIIVDDYGGRTDIMGAWIKPLDGSTTNVAFVTITRDLNMKMFINLTDDDFHKRFAQLVEILKSGK